MVSFHWRGHIYYYYRGSHIDPNAMIWLAIAPGYGPDDEADKGKRAVLWNNLFIAQIYSLWDAVCCCRCAVSIIRVRNPQTFFMAVFR